jgi:hypothetical protein
MLCCYLRTFSDDPDRWNFWLEFPSLEKWRFGGKILRRDIKRADKIEPIFRV